MGMSQKYESKNVKINSKLDLEIQDNIVQQINSINNNIGK